MKLLQTKDYLLLIDREAEIKPDDYIIHDTVEGVIEANDEWHYRGEKDDYWNKVIAYYPLTKEAKELDLPLLPPFERINIKEQLDYFIEDCLKEAYPSKANIVAGVLYILDKATHSKQFSLEDMIAFGKKCFYKGFDKSEKDDSNCYTAWREENLGLVQSLTTQQLPKEFVGWLSKKKCLYDFTSRCTIDRCDCEFVFETITNSEGKEELVGTYKY